MAPKEPPWVRLDAVLAIHRRQLSEHGGLDGIRDQGMLESALGRPTNKYSYESPKPSLAQLAAAYAFGIARNHPFIDGNKRTAFVVCELFLRLNKQGIEASAEGKYIPWRVFLLSTVRALVASVIMILFLEMLTAQCGSALIACAVAIPAGCITYGLACLILRSPELSESLALIRRLSSRA